MQSMIIVEDGSSMGPVRADIVGEAFELDGYMVNVYYIGNGYRYESPSELCGLLQKRDAAYLHRETIIDGWKMGAPYFKELLTAMGEADYKTSTLIASHTTVNSVTNKNIPPEELRLIRKAKYLDLLLLPNISRNIRETLKRLQEGKERYIDTILL